ncbi:hypothetical protein G1H11_21355 [Phytoactinopolyspora alkaliphila]|uniref:Hydrolase n=1 Tax=Phytoactinopolyspora alkaliphila TaxID=1783498 RepID=A0A6N9YSR6_9ACTN|nr:SGNH/GDSL hydrolase family protein [Phytoactinopolyspora alkaliphila]NED97849.1 hypothetical protein [Phytoactinopolyspora alkaliphila]
MCNIQAGDACQALPGRLRWVRFGEPEGRGWRCPAAERLTDRLPARAERMVPKPVWNLSRHASGLYYRFRTDAREIGVRWTLPAGPIASPHMSALSVSGVDLYTEDEHGRLRFAAAGLPHRPGEQTCLLIDGIAHKPKREYRLYLPMYNRADDVAVGVDPGARLELSPPDPAPPVVHYGSSIVQGSAASRPGMSVPAILGRRIGRPVINLGLSGSAKMEISLAVLIAEIDAALFVVDALPNMTAKHVADRAEPFIRHLRERRPDVPILLVEDRTRTDAWWRPDAMDDHAAKRAELRSVYRRLVEQGDRRLLYLDHDGMVGRDGDGTVDGSHPTDLGAHHMLQRLEPIVRSALEHAGLTHEPAT